jgi:hypothetical protein
MLRKPLRFPADLRACRSQRFALAHHNDQVCPADLRQAVGDDQVVRPLAAVKMARWILSSVALSIALVESSSTRMRGSVRKARARASAGAARPKASPRARRSPSHSPRKGLINSCAWAACATALTSRGWHLACQRRCSQRSSARTGRYPAR